MEDLRVLIEESPTFYLHEIVDYLAVVHEIHISTTALHNNLQALGLTYKMMQRTASQRDEQARQAWRDDGKRPTETTPLERGDRWSI
ncbi:hypothetical protein BDN67DRAFT_1053927 [Paxillus ammoniavirescens]|nr:hypothetical protein BDN67DRAFT_1053927 [Paxillus ammoniavirescens]